MPNVSMFYGISIRIYYNDHNPPHFHAKYGKDEAVVEIGTGSFLEGSLPRRARGHVLEWLDLHRDELLVNWDLARQGMPLNPIESLE